MYSQLQKKKSIVKQLRLKGFTLLQAVYYFFNFTFICTCFLKPSYCLQQTFSPHTFILQVTATEGIYLFGASILNDEKLKKILYFLYTYNYSQVCGLIVCLPHLCFTHEFIYLFNKRQDLQFFIQSTVEGGEKQCSATCQNFSLDDSLCIQTDPEMLDHVFCNNFHKTKKAKTNKKKKQDIKHRRN